MLIDAEFADQNAFTPIVRRTTALSLSDFFPFLFRRRPWGQIRDVCTKQLRFFVRGSYAVSRDLECVARTGIRWQNPPRDPYVSLTQRHPQ